MRWVAGCDDVQMANDGLQAFRMTIEAVVTLTGRPGVHLGGDIESGVVQVGDRLDLLDHGKLINVVTCDGLGSLNRIGGTDRYLPSVHCVSLSRGEVREGQVLAGAVAIFGKRRLLLGLLQHNPGVHHVPFRTEIWPLQWRMAVSWISGYLTLPLFTPILFHSPWGAIEAGRMGMTMGIAAKLSDVAIAWMNTKSAPFGRLIALRNYAELDRRFFKSLIQSAAIGTAAAAMVWLLAQWMNYHGNYLATRLLSPLALALVLFGYVGNVVVTSLAIYLRAHKQEKFMVNSILGALYTAPAAFFAGRAYGGLGIACVYALGTLVIGLGYGTYTFQKYRRAWHG